MFSVTGTSRTFASHFLLLHRPPSTLTTSGTTLVCLPHTRVDILKQIIEWADGGNERCIFWLNGTAGTGKSTIARTVARKYHDQGRLGASFFFSRGAGDVSHAGKFFTSIAVQLANESRILRRYICEAIAKPSASLPATSGISLSLGYYRSWTATPLSRIFL
jgi:hypothetical protein